MNNNTGETVVSAEDRICPVCGAPKSAYAKKCRECFELQEAEEEED